MLTFDWLRYGFGTRDSALPDGAAASVQQIHSSKVVRADAAGVQGEADGLISNTAGLLLAIRTADCFPVLLADPQNRAVAAVHAGWRGVAGGIVPVAIDAMRVAFGTRPSDLHIVIGPGIGPCCFEVGPEVAVQFGREGRVKLDLAREIARQSGVPDDQVHLAHLCTFCDPVQFHSYRRDGAAAGRMTSYIGIRTA